MARSRRPFTFAVYDAAGQFLDHGEAPTRTAALAAALALTRERGGTAWIVWRPDSSAIRSISPGLWTPEEQQRKVAAARRAIEVPKTRRRNARGKAYVRVTVAAPTTDGRTARRTVWAVRLPSRGGLRVYAVVDRSGAEPSVYRPDGTLVVRRELIIASPGDVIREQPAQMNLTYAELEVVTEK
jgi:hypothetical protein